MNFYILTLRTNLTIEELHYYHYIIYSILSYGRKYGNIADNKLLTYFPLNILNDVNLR